MSKLSVLTQGFEAVIFDFDGVVADTEKLHFKAWNKGFAILGNSLTQEEYNPLKSTGRKHIVDTFSKKIGKEITPSKQEQICKVKDEYFSELCQNADKSLLINGVEDFLKELCASGKKIAVASSASTTTFMLEKLGIGHYFDIVVDGNMKLPKKPQPDVFLKAAELLGVNSQKCLVFEDSPAGIRAAENAGMSFVSVGGLKSDKAILNITDFS